MVFLLFSHPYCFNLMFDSNSSVCVVAGGGALVCVCCMCYVCACMWTLEDSLGTLPQAYPHFLFFLLAGGFSSLELTN